jgi:FkbM family methyltransferase
MIEAQPNLQPILERVAAEIGNATLHNCLLTAEERASVEFYEMGTGSSVMPERSNAAREVLHLPSRTLDQVWRAEQPVQSPVFVKLDVQGAELDVLRGGMTPLKAAEWFQLECALLDYNEGAPQLQEICNFMSAYGLYATEVAGFSRPREHLVQIDLLFAREQSPLRPQHFVF